MTAEQFLTSKGYKEAVFNALTIPVMEEFATAHTLQHLENLKKELEREIKQLIVYEGESYLIRRRKLS